MFDLLILTLEKTVFDAQVHSIVIPGADGYFEILSNHAPLIALVQLGRVEIQQKEGEKEVYAISGGFFEVAHNKAILLADTLEKASEIDYQRATNSLEKAKERLASGNNHLDAARAKRAMKRAENRIKIYQTSFPNGRES